MMDDDKVRDELADEPSVCEFGDIAPVIHWNDPADSECGSGSWLLIGGGDVPSPLCGKHAAIIRDRLDLASHGVRLIPA